MAETKTALKMVFADANGDERIVSLDNPKAGLTETEVRAWMNLCITKSALLTSKDQPVATIKEAYNEVTTRTDIITPVETSSPAGKIVPGSERITQKSL